MAIHVEPNSAGLMCLYPDPTKPGSLVKSCHPCLNGGLCLLFPGSLEQGITKLFTLGKNFKDHLLQNLCHRQRHLQETACFSEQWQNRKEIEEHWTCGKKKLGQKYSVVHKAKYFKALSFLHTFTLVTFPSFSLWACMCIVTYVWCHSVGGLSYLEVGLQ